LWHSPTPLGTNTNVGGPNLEETPRCHRRALQ
jgi:hypothetical protein